MGLGASGPRAAKSAPRLFIVVVIPARRINVLPNEPSRPGVPSPTASVSPFRRRCPCRQGDRACERVRFTSCRASGPTAGTASGAVFSPGNVIVFRAGDGNAPAAGQAHANVNIQEFTTSGSLVQTIALPSGASSSAFTIDRTATADGILQWSADKRYLMFAGYSNAAGNGQSNLSFTTGATNRMGARIDNTGTATPEIFQLAGNGGQVRGLTAATGTTSYVSKSDGGPRLVTNGATSGSGVVLSNTFGGTANYASRQTSIVDGNLYTTYTNAVGASTGTYPGPGIFRYDGIPTTSSSTVTRIVTGSSFQSFFFADLDAAVAGVDTLWAVDTAGNDIEKYSLVGGTWTANGSVPAGGIQNLDGIVTGSGTVTLFGAQPTKVSTLTDTSGYNGVNAGAVTDIAGIVPGDNNMFKGIAVAVPEPTSLALLGLGGLTLLARRRGSR
jgi:hypothetical protein